jgi:hypothetical protein
MRSKLLISALIAACCGTAVAQEVTLQGRCHLTFEKTVNAKGPCTVHQVGATVSIKGTVEENGQQYLAIINNDKNTGLLLGAGTFTLADGPLASNKSDKVSWPNGYVLKFRD